MAEIRWPEFGAAVRTRLDGVGFSYDRAVEKWPQTNKGMWSRCCRGVRLEAGTFVLVCKLLGLDPFAFLDDGKRRRVTRKSILKQFVTAGVGRETPEVLP